MRTSHKQVMEELGEVEKVKTEFNVLLGRIETVLCQVQVFTFYIPGMK